MAKPDITAVAANFEQMVTHMSAERAAGIAQPPVSPLQGAIADALAGLKSDLVLTGDEQVATRPAGGKDKSIEGGIA